MNCCTWMQQSPFEFYFTTGFILTVNNNTIYGVFNNEASYNIIAYFKF